MKTTEDLIKNFNLPPYIKGKSFAEASKAIQNKFKERTDKYSSDTMEELMSRLSKAQEYVKMQDSLKNESQQVPDQMNGEIPKGMEQFTQQGQPEQPQQGDVPQGMEQFALGGPTDPPTQTSALDSLPGIGRQLINPQTKSLRNVLFNDPTGNRSLTKDANGKFFLIPQKELQYDPKGWKYSGNREQPMSSAQAAYFMKNTELPQPQLEQQQMAYGGDTNQYHRGGELDPNYFKQGLGNTDHNFGTPAVGGLSDSNGIANSNSTDGISPDTPDAGAYVGAASTALDLGKTAFGPTGIDTSGRIAAPKVQGAGIGAATGAVKGAKAGAALGPWGAAIGGVVGGVAGLVGGKKAKNDAREAATNYVQGQNANYRQSDFAYGGGMNKYVKGGPFDKTISDEEYYKLSNSFKNLNKPGFTNYKTPNYGGAYNNPTDDNNPTEFAKKQKTKASFNLGKSFFNQDPASIAPSHEFGTNLKKYNTNQGKTGVGKALDFLGKNAGDIVSYAPVAGNLLGLKNLKQGTTERGARLKGVYKPQLYDESRLQNVLNQQNTQRALTESSGGDLGALRSNLLAAGLNKQKAQSTALAGADAQNIAERKYAFQTGRQKDQINTRLEQDFINRKEADKGAFNTAKASLQTQLGQDIGNIGREESNKKLIKTMLGYTTDGRYYITKDGQRITRDEALIEAKAKQAKIKADKT